MVAGVCGGSLRRFLESVGVKSGPSVSSVKHVSQSQAALSLPEITQTRRPLTPGQD